MCELENIRCSVHRMANSGDVKNKDSALLQGCVVLALIITMFYWIIGVMETM